MLTETQTHHDEAALMRRLLGITGEDIPADQVERILETCGWDGDLAATAVLMCPPPTWVADIVGPLLIPDAPPEEKT